MSETWNEILPGLWMGGTPDDEWIDIPAAWPAGVQRDERPFDVVVSLFALSQPFGWGVQELRYGFADGDPRRIDMDAVVDVAAWAYEQWRLGHRVLVRCQAGLNRSGLVTALVLVLDGWDPADAVALIRRCRSSMALCNEDFVEWLHANASSIVASRTRPQVA